MTAYKKLIWCVVPLAFSLSACSLLSPDNRTRSKVPVRDVDYRARAQTVTGLRHRILILPFIDEKVNRTQKVADTARSALITSIGKTGNFVIVNNSDLSQDPAKFMTENREYDLEKIAPIAASIGVTAIVEGKVMQIKARRIGDQVGLIRELKANVDSTVRLRVMSSRNAKMILEDVRTGSVESSTTRIAEYSFSDRMLEEDPGLVKQSVTQAFYGSMPHLVRAIEKLSWEGRVAMVTGERVFVNAGRLTGIQVGDILKVTEEGEEVFDPENGAFIGRAPGRMKGTLEVISYFGKDGAIGIVHSGSGFQENDRVELY